MPFTFAHPAAVIWLPARFRRYFCFTGLIVGSMAPDFEYFLHFKPHSVWGHTLIGFFLYDLPLALIASWLFHRVIKRPLLLHLPAPLDRWYAPLASTPWSIRSGKAVLLFASSALIGMATHVLWDHFTHQNGYVVIHVDALRTRIPLLLAEVPLYKLAQHGSTLVGLTVIAAYLYKLRDRRGSRAFQQGRTRAQKRHYWIRIILASCVILTSKLCFFASTLFEWPPIGELVVTSLDSVLIAMLLVSLWANRRLIEEQRPFIPKP